MADTSAPRTGGTPADRGDDTRPPRTGGILAPLTGGTPLVRQDRASTTRPERVTSALVLGLGRYGEALSRELRTLGIDVFAVDMDDARVNALADVLSRVVRADFTRVELLDQIGLEDFDRVIVATSTPIETNILAVSQLLHRGVENLWVKAANDQHELILQQLGVHHIVHPSRDMGYRSAHRLISYADDWMSLGAGAAAITMELPELLIERSTADERIEKRFHVTVVARLRHGAHAWQDVDHTTIFTAKDRILVVGEEKTVQHFAQLD